MKAYHIHRCNLLRHLTWELPSGQAIAEAIGAPVLLRADFTELQPIFPAFADHTPLWYYILKEAELMQDGLQLGPVGARIVGEVFIGLLQSDPDSYPQPAAGLPACPPDRVRPPG